MSGLTLLLGLPMFMRFPCYACHPILLRAAIMVLVAVTSHYVSGFTFSGRLTTAISVLRSLTGFICITACITALHELSAVCFLPEPREGFRLNDKVVCVVLSYYWVLVVYINARLMAYQRKQRRRRDPSSSCSVVLCVSPVALCG